MADQKAKDIISLEGKLRGQQSNFRNLWQDTADLTYPRENQIVDQNMPGQRKTDRIYDTTAIMESQNMASGLSQNLIPPGQKFFALKPSNKDLQEIEDVKRYLNKATEVVHDELFASNFMLQLTETLRSLVVFGTGNLYEEYKATLSFKDYAIGTYQIMENAQGLVDTVVLKFPLTCKQAKEQFESPGKSVEECEDNEEDKKFWYIHVVRPRKERNLNFTDNLNMPFESLYVSVQDCEVVEEGGFEEFPYQVSRWLKSSTEKYGRGQGTEILPQTRVVQGMARDWTECANKWNNPPREILESFEGEVNVSPNANNYVEQRGTIAAIDEGVRGNFPITEKALDSQRKIIKEAFFADAFAPLSDLTGDRRTTTEIRARIQESFRKIGSPIGRIQSELFTPMITRVVLLLLRNGKIAPPPPELEGEDFKVEYVGPLSLAMKNSEVAASQQWIGIVAEIDAIEPSAKDNIDWDDSVRRMARAFGVNEEDIASQEEVQEKRDARAQQIKEQKQAEQLQAMGQAYPGATKAPEPGSPAGELMNAQ